MLNRKWEEITRIAKHAFQPIVNIHTGVCFGYEVLLRGYREAGFNSIEDFFDEAFRDKCLYAVDLILREKALAQFCKIPNHHRMKMFYNLDNRILMMPDYKPGHTHDFIKKFGLDESSLCFEISEKHQILYSIESKSILNLYKQQHYQIAVDDFGSGFSGLQLLYHSEPNFIKIDSFFVYGISTDRKKKLFVSNIINLAHILGIKVIVEGVENVDEFYTCKTIGCDYVQGYLIQKPTTDIRQMELKYDNVQELNRKDRRDKAVDSKLIFEQMEHITPIRIPDHDLKYLFESFRKHSNVTFFPVINVNGEPVGIIKEKELKEFVYSPYGKDLILNRAFGKTLEEFITKVPISEINNRVEKVLEIFSMAENCEGILITSSGKYIGFLSANALVKAINEKNLTLARNQNPLTRLPGNNMINSHIAEVMEENKRNKAFIYFDFDNFKPFNDKYGFRLGDRAILLFSEMLSAYASIHNFFVGHIGGDDFFACSFYENEASILELVDDINTKFRDDAKTFFNKDEKLNSYFISTDREGNKRKFPLLTVSASCLFVKAGSEDKVANKISSTIAGLKKQAKIAENKISYSIV